jgi:hypothetical protein
MERYVMTAGNRGFFMSGPVGGLVRLSALALVIAGSQMLAGAWGGPGHEIVTVEAVNRLPQPLQQFLASRISELKKKTLEPDRYLKSKDPDESSRHFVHLDVLGLGAAGVTSSFRTQLIAERGAGYLKKHGTLPWRIQEIFDDLVAMFRSGDQDEIIRLAGYIAHYVGDAYQPLHLVQNYDGRKTCNEGIHKAFESNMILLFRDEIAESVKKGAKSDVAPAALFPSLLEEMNATAELAPVIFKADRAAIRSLKQHRRDYYRTLHKSIGPLAARQMSGAANAISLLWRMAWEQAGRPELNGME